MVDTSGMIDEIVTEYVDAGEYFTINRARQYGKTTTSDSLPTVATIYRNRYQFEGKDEYLPSFHVGGRLRRRSTILKKSNEDCRIFQPGIDKEFPLAI
jgi:hypothetical protein